MHALIVTKGTLIVADAALVSVTLVTSGEKAGRIQARVLTDPHTMHVCEEPVLFGTCAEILRASQEVAASREHAAFLEACDSLSSHATATTAAA